MRLREDGMPKFFVHPSASPDYELNVPPQGLTGPGLIASDIRAAYLPKNLTFTLPDDIFFSEAITGAEIVSGFASTSSQAYGFNDLVRYGEPPALTVVNQTLTVQWKAGTFASYAPRAPETVVLSLPPEAVRSGVPLAVGSFVITVDPGSVSMAGALLGQAYEADLRDEVAHTLDVTLSGDTWLPSIGLEGAASAALLRGFASAQQEVGGWNQAVQPLLTSADLLRLDAYTVRLTIPQRANYDIIAPETLSLTVPPEATFAAHSLAAPQVIVVAAAAGVATMSGTLTEDRQGRTIRVSPTTLVVALSRDSWVNGLWEPTSNPLLADALLDAFIASTLTLEEAAWAGVVRPALDSSMISLLDNRTLLLSIPALPAYRLVGASEVISLHLPPELLTSDQPIHAQPPLEIVRSES